jgi:hypothetical protein
MARCGANTTLQIAHGDVSTRTITSSSAAFTDMFDDVTRIAAS